MSDENGTVAGARDAQVDAAQAVDAASLQRQAIEAGAMLRQMRESAGVDPLLLASTLKVASQKIQALEEGRFDDLPDMTFARGLAAAVCRAFGVDPEPVLALMPMPAARGLQRQPAETGDEHPQPRQPLAPVTFSTDSGSFGLLRWFADVPVWLAIVVVVLLIGALVVWFLPAGRTVGPDVVPQVTSSAASEAEQASAAASAASDVASDVASGAAGLASDADPASAPVSASSADLVQGVTVSATLPVASAINPASHASAAAVAPRPVASAASAPKAAASVASTARAAASVASVASASRMAASVASGEVRQGSGVTESNVVTFSATGPVWVGVIDGSGKTVLGRVLQEGDAVSIGGELPLAVTVGDKSAVTVTARGVPVDLDKHSRSGGTVARFTVDPVRAP